MSKSNVSFEAKRFLGIKRDYTKKEVETNKVPIKDISIIIIF